MSLYARVYTPTARMGCLVMALACPKPLPLYRPRDPRASDLWRLMDQHFETIRQVYDERFHANYGFWRPVVERSVTAFLKCGDLQEGFARVRCVRLLPARRDSSPFPASSVAGVPSATRNAPY